MSIEILTTTPGATQTRAFGLWGRAFRPFFLGGAIHAALAVPWWIAIWLGALDAPRWLIPMWWHGHEMVFGFVAAAIAGFLLTASPVWTGGPTLVGRPLAALFGLWVAGRIAFGLAGWVPVVWVAAIDVAFLPAVAWAMSRTLRGSGQWRNYGVLGVVVALAIANAVTHADALGVWPGLAGRALRGAALLVVVLILVVGGRITPAFTRNAFRQRGIAREVLVWPWLDRATIAAAVTFFAASIVFGPSPTTGALALTTALLALVRWAGWRGVHTGFDPLLWSLHAGTAWVVVGLVLVGAANLGAAIPPSAGLHALTAGAMGATILAVMPRVGLGHTGRALVLPRGMVEAFWLVHAAAVARVGAAFFVGPTNRALLIVGAMAWSFAFGLFAIRYAGLLTTARPDGRPG